MNEKEFLRKFATKIRILRIANNLSQEQLAELINMERAYISRVENNKTYPNVPILKQIADALNVEITELFNFTI